MCHYNKRWNTIKAGDCLITSRSPSNVFLLLSEKTLLIFRKNIFSIEKDSKYSSVLRVQENYNNVADVDISNWKFIACGS